jgi:hypothetical protein
MNVSAFSYKFLTLLQYLSLDCLAYFQFSKNMKELKIFLSQNSYFKEKMDFKFHLELNLIKGLEL